NMETMNVEKGMGSGIKSPTGPDGAPEDDTPPGAAMPNAPMLGAPMQGAPMQGAPMNGVPMQGMPTGPMGGQPLPPAPAPKNPWSYGRLWMRVPGNAAYIISTFVLAMVWIGVLMGLFFTGVGMIIL